MVWCGCATTTDDPGGNRCTCRRYGIECTVLSKQCCGLSGINVAKVNRFFYTDSDDDIL